MNKHVSLVVALFHILRTRCLTLPARPGDLQFYVHVGMLVAPGWVEDTRGPLCNMGVLTQLPPYDPRQPRRSAPSGDIGGRPLGG